MSSIIEELRLAGKVALDLDYQRGSLLDYSGNGNVSTVVGAPRFDDCGGERGLRMNIVSGVANSISVAASASINLQQLTACVKTAPLTDFVTSQRILCKRSGTTDWDWYIGTPPGVVGLWNGGVAMTIPLRAEPTRFFGLRKTVGVTIPEFWQNATRRGYGSSPGVLPAPSATPLGIGNYGDGVTVLPLLVPIQRVLLLNDGTITDVQIAQIYLEMMAERSVVGLPRRIAYSYPSMRASEYAAKGIVLDTDFQPYMDGAARKVRDCTGNYPGTITGCPMPGPGGEGISITSAVQDIQFGDVTQLNAVKSFSMEYSHTLPPGNVPVGYSLIKIGVWPDAVRVGPVGGPAPVKVLYFGVGQGGVSRWGTTTTGMVRGGTSQHVMAVFNGDGIGDSGRAQVYVDGEDAGWVQLGGPMPAITENMVGGNLAMGLGAALAATYHGVRLHTGALTAAQARKAYLDNFARQIDWQVPGEDIPVSLEASVGAGKHIGPWTVVNGLWRHSEDSLGRRWIECVSAGAIYTPQPNAFGTFRFSMYRAADVGTAQLVQFCASLPNTYLTPSQNGYCLYIQTGRTLVLGTITNGSVVGVLTATGAGYITIGTLYHFAVPRRPSDGRFKLYAQPDQGSWSLVGTSAAEATYTNTKYMVLNFASGDKLLDYDPTIPGRPASIQHYRGVLDPTVPGELPR